MYVDTWMLYISIKFLEQMLILFCINSWANKLHENLDSTNGSVVINELHFRVNIPFQLSPQMATVENTQLCPNSQNRIMEFVKLYLFAGFKCMDV